MRVSIQQPEHAPWLGFFYKMSLCDTTVMFDTVQFKKRYFDNRNRILSTHGEQWLTVPVLSKGRYTQNICDVQICNDTNWRRKYLASIEHSYIRAPFFTKLFPELKVIIQSDFNFLADLNLEIIRWCARSLGIETNIVLASQLGTFSSHSTQLLLEICQAVDAQDYLCGKSGPDYMDLELFSKAGIAVEVVNYQPREYPQHLPGFVGYLSVFDLLFQHGPQAHQYLAPLEEKK